MSTIPLSNKSLFNLLYQSYIRGVGAGLRDDVNSDNIKQIFLKEWEEIWKDRITEYWLNDHEKQRIELLEKEVEELKRQLKNE